MKKTKVLKGLLPFFLAAMALSMTACEKIEENHSSTTENRAEAVSSEVSLEECLQQVAAPEQLLIINSQEEFDSVFRECAMPLDVDFSSKTLLCIYGYCTQCIIDTNARVDFNEDSSVTVTITVKLGDCLSAEPWYIAFVCDKIESNQNVSLLINYLQ